MKTIRIGSRESKLAVVQAEMVMDAIRTLHPDWRLELVTMKTTGDKILDQSLDKIGGKGLFVKELDAALHENRVDICVHSYKDMPVPGSPALPVVAVSRREDPRDVLILPAGQDAPDPEKPIGCSSLRRTLQLKTIFPHIPVEPVRGNVLTRLRKLDEGQYGALVLAAAGLKRLGLFGRASRVFGPDDMIPAACQGILAIQGRAEDDLGWLGGLNDAEAWDCSLAERAFIETLEGGCTSPACAFAEVDGPDMRLRGLYANEDNRVFTRAIEGRRADAAQLGHTLAQKLKEEGAKA